MYILRVEESALASLAQLLGVVPQTQRSPVRFPVRAFAWVVGLVPGRGPYRRQPVDVSFACQCFPLSIPSPSLKKKERVEKSEDRLKAFSLLYNNSENMYIVFNTP